MTGAPRKKGLTERVFGGISRAMDMVSPNRRKRHQAALRTQPKLGEGGQTAFDEAIREQRRRPGLRSR